MERIDELPPAIRYRLPEGPATTDWLLTELSRADAAVIRVHTLERKVTCRGPEHSPTGSR
jgi:hypothetical protein